MNKILSTIKEFITAYSLDGKIYNCTEHSFIWYHEKGHLEQQKNKIFFPVFCWSYYFAPMLLIAFRSHITIFYSVGMIWITLVLYAEIDAWIYVIKYYPVRIIGNNQP